MTTQNILDSGLYGVTGTGMYVGSTSPTLVTPILGTPQSGDLSNCTGYPVGSLPAGTMFNFQQGVLTASSAAGSNGTWVTTGLSVSITPTSSSNNVLIRATVNGSMSNDKAAMFAIYNGSSLIGLGDVTGSATSCTSYNNNAGLGNAQPTQLEWLDSPATTSPITYTIYFFATSTSNFYMNSYMGSSGTTNNPAAVSTISVCEIKV